MDFDQLLKKYLAGTLSDAELERFRDLLERTPEYKVELRQTLELRSLIQDDALHLNPPQEVSDRIRLAVGARFAAESPVRKRRDEERRRAGFFPFRIASGVVATTFIALMVALGPSVVNEFRQAPSAGNRIVEIAPTAMPQAAAPQVAGVAGGSAMASPGNDLHRASNGTGNGTNNGTGRNWRGADGRVHAPRPATAAADALASLTTPAPTDPASTVTPPTQEAPQQSLMILQGDQQEPNRSEEGLPLALLAQQNYAQSPRSDSMPHPVSQGLAPVKSVDAEDLAALTAATTGTGSPRRMSVGVTLGAGGVAGSGASNPMLQNSYYFSFSVSGSDRIGLEMGSSSFQQAKMTSVVSPAGGFAKGASAGGDSKDPSAPVTSQLQTRMVEQRLEQQITYGAVFYDRRIRVSNKWDICGRATVGAADNALVGNLRAYGAFSPSKNVTLTVGVGGSALYNFSSKSQTNSQNYGIYYGIETGF